MIKGKFSILVVDDHPKIRLLVSKWLLDEGYDVVTAVDGRDCISKVSSGTDLVLLDIMMPGLTPDKIIDGVVRKNAKVKIVYLTAVDAFNPTKEQEERGWVPEVKPPVIGYIQKPIENADFIRKIRDFIRKIATVISMSGVKEKDVMKY